MHLWICTSPTCGFEEWALSSRYCMWCGQDMMALDPGAVAEQQDDQAGELAGETRPVEEVVAEPGM